MKVKTNFFCIFTIILLVSFLPDNSFCQDSDLLREGIRQYKEENYEEAVEILIKVRSEDPKSSIAAFFLGMARKQAMDYSGASANLNDAITLTPRIKEALVELIDVSLQLGEFEEAKKWIDVSEKEGIFPARTAFLKGMILQKEDRNFEAVEAFKKAKDLDESLTQSSDFRIAICYLKEKKLKKAKARFNAAVLHDPTSDLASFARNYQDIVEKRIFLERPLRFTVGLLGQYDTNMVLKPTEDAAASGITDEKSYASTASLRVDYVPVLEGPWLFNAQYSFVSNLHENHVHTHDMMANSISITPGYNFGRYALNLAVSYSYFLLRDPGYKEYMDDLSVGPLLRVLLNDNHILETFAGYSRKEYFQPPLSPDEDRDSNGFNAYIGWTWLLREDTFLNLKYAFSKEDADGANWDNEGHRFTANAIIPIVDKLKLQLSADEFLQYYRHSHTSFEKKREDRVNTASVGLTWEFIENASFITQYTRTRCNSNLGIYDYRRNLNQSMMNC